MKLYYEIEIRDDLSEGWLCPENLMSILEGKTVPGRGTILEAKQIKTPEEIGVGAIFDFMGFISMGEEFGVGAPQDATLLLARYTAWAEARGVTAEDVDPRTWLADVMNTAPDAPA